jgi:nucleoside-diphosphate-sugar epimerase
MKVFVTGATGYIGSHVARAFRRADHDVWGLLRNKEKSKSLEEAEIHPVVGTLQDPRSYLAAAEPCALLVHAAVDYAADTFALDRQTVEGLIGSGERGAQPKTLLYTSGTWVYGETGDRRVDETTPLTPAERVAWRPGNERLVLESRSVRGLVVRPGCVYGGPGGMTGDWFGGAHDKKGVSIVGDGRNRWAMVHVDDLADGYVRVGESGLSNEIFNLVDPSRATVEEMATAAARASGFSGEVGRISVAEASKTLGSFAECLALDQHVDAGKAARVLGWVPRHSGFVSEAETHFRSWKASRGRVSG